VNEGDMVRSDADGPRTLCLDCGCRLWAVVACLWDKASGGMVAHKSLSATASGGWAYAGGPMREGAGWGPRSGHGCASCIVVARC
jgi:hypothetical protein